MIPEPHNQQVYDLFIGEVVADRKLRDPLVMRAGRLTAMETEAVAQMHPVTVDSRASMSFSGNSHPYLSVFCVFSIDSPQSFTLIINRELRISWARSHSSTLGEIDMNKNQVKGEIKDIAGKVQEETGKLVGNREQQAKGLQKQGEGKAEKRLGDVKEVVRDTKDALKDAVKKH